VSLASDVVEGKPVKLEGYGWQKCAMAEVVRRSGVASDPSDPEGLAPCLDKLLPDPHYTGSPAVGHGQQRDHRSGLGRPKSEGQGALVFPLLAFADAARARARKAK